MRLYTMNGCVVPKAIIGQRKFQTTGKKPENDINGVRMQKREGSNADDDIPGRYR